MLSNCCEILILGADWKTLVFYGQWNKLARSITKWTKDLWQTDYLVWYLIFITHVNTNSIAMWVILQNNADWDCFQDSDFARDLEDSKSTSGGNIMCFWKSYICSNKFWCVRNKLQFRTSSTESEIVSLDAGLRLDGIPGLDVWDLIVLVLGNTIQNHDRKEEPVVGHDKSHKPSQQSRGMFNVLNNVDCVPSNVQFSHQEALLYVFEDHEAVIKMIIKGEEVPQWDMFPGPTELRDWLFDRINLDPKIQIKYIDTKNQLADMLTKGNFTRDEWNHLLCSFNISHFSSTVCAEKMAERNTTRFRWRKSHSQSRGQWWVLLQGLPQLCHLRRQKARGRKAMKGKAPWSAKAEKDDRTGQPVVDCHKQFIESSARYSRWDDDKAWSSQKWKADELMDDRTGETRYNLLGKDTRVPIKFLSWEDQARYFGRGRESHDRTGQPVVLPSTRSKATAIHHWRRRNRIRIVVGIQIILEQCEWSSAEKTKTIFEWYVTEKRRKTFCDMGNVHSLQH